jgi:SAM-dependent methyltransferase
MIKRLPIHRRPWFCSRILEVGGGHAPFAGVTHAVDKFPEDNRERAQDLKLPPGVEFHEGELERLPFEQGSRFDFIYVSHVLEHSADPLRAVAEINRVAVRGYLETPSPLREQLAGTYPYAPETDYHRLFCWAGKDLNQLHLVMKGAGTVGRFCECPNGRLARQLFEINKGQSRARVDLEPLLPFSAKTTRLHFRAPLKARVHASFAEACASGCCAYGEIRAARRWASWPFRWLAPRFSELRRILSSLAAEARA